MSARIKPTALLTLLVGALLAALPFAVAADAILAVDPGIYDVWAPTEGPEYAGVALRFENGALQVQLIAEGEGSLPDAVLGFTGETPRLAPFDRVHLSAALGRSPQVRTVVGGVILEHHETSVSALRQAYAAALAELGFTLNSSSTRTRWDFVNGTAAIRVNVAPDGQNVTAYVGR
jgi:hypothetical protein